MQSRNHKQTGVEFVGSKLIKFLLITALFLITVACAKDNKSDPDEIAVNLKKSISLDEYEVFQSLFSSHLKEEATKELFDKLKEINDSRADFKSYSLITLGNGQMILVNHVPRDNFKIQKVIIVSNDLKQLIEKEVVNQK
ncbi:hypothetical protein [Paenibacillus dokdonensis]|uniref:hypothetical protein n=1 Tax=Paenibacillus dokdonensis TaxID=2567944 RepID=UPI0010A8561B|nr:hypothetical protein [Paenibacillus dokdonensis]